MRFIMMVKGTTASEAGVMPTRAQIAAMGAYNEELAKAGVLVELSGLKPTSAGAKVCFEGGKPKLIKGPFGGAKDIVSGFWIINVTDADEAFAWAMKAPNPAFNDTEGEIEVRPFFEPSDFA
jgi:hypothetical protein